MNASSSRRTAFCCSILAALATGSAMAEPEPNASTSFSITPTPVLLSLDAAPDAVADTQTTSAAVSTAVIDAGKITIEMATYLGLPTTVATPGFVWTGLPPGNMNPSGGATASSIDFDGLGFVDGMQASFRAHYVTGGGAVKADEHKSPIIDIGAGSQTCSGGFNISADLASGNGSPAPGATGPWAFRITLENCTGVDLTGIKAQGGSNGWAPMTSNVPSTGTVAVRLNNKNQVLTWNLDMAQGTTETILVNVDGKIPAKTACDSIRYLSGPWSAVYNAGAGAQKSEYTGRVSVQVTCP
jgi:hypothetical protein